MHFHDKSREVCIKARSLPASLPFKGQVTEQRTVKWSFGHCNRPFPSSLVPLCFKTSLSAKPFLWKWLIYMKMKLHAELIFIWKVSHLDSFWNSGTRELGNENENENENETQSSSTEYYLPKVRLTTVCRENLCHLDHKFRNHDFSSSSRPGSKAFTGDNNLL